MKNIKKIIGSVLLAAAFTATSVGTTFALFTDEAKTTINVESGKIDLKSALTIAEVKSLNDSTIDTHTVVTDSKHAAYENGGSVAITSDALTGSETVAINYWTPGDSVKLLATPDNTGTNIKTLIRLQVTMSGELAPALTVKGFAGDATTPSLAMTGVKTVVSGWTPVDAGENPSAYYLEIAFPNHGYEITPREQGIDNQYQEKQATIVVSYQAVQGNAAVNDVLERANSLLALHEVNTGSRYATMHDALEGIKSNFSAAELEILAQYVWGSQEDQFYVASAQNSNHNYFKQYSAMPAEQTYSIYAVQGDTDWNVISGLTVGFDAGDIVTITEITYDRHSAAANEGQEVIIRTNGGVLKVNAPFDTVRHYGSAQLIDLTAVGNNSYYENGNVMLVDIKKGRLVITDEVSANVGTIYLSAKNEDEYDEIILATQDEAKLPSIVAREEVSLPENAGDKKLVVTIQQVDEAGVADADKTEEIYLYGASDVKEQEKGYDVSDMGLLVVEALSTEGKAEAAEQLAEKSEAVKEAVKETKVKEAEEVKSEASSFNGGKGVESDPYLIANGNQWYNFIKTHNGKYIGSWNGYGWEDMYVTLIGDIDMEGYDISGFETYPYSVILNGRNHKFSNLTSSIWGKYGDFYGQSVMKNFTVENSTSRYSFLGYGPAEYNTTTITINNVTIKNCECDGGLFLFYTGAAEINFIDCVAKDALVHGPNYMAGGGYVGNGQNITINNCKFGGSVVAESTNMIAGFVGQGANNGITITNSEVTEGSIIRSIANNGKVAAFDGQASGTEPYSGNNQFNGILSCDKESNAKKQGSGAQWVEFVSLKNADFALDEEGNISYIGEAERSFSKVTISESIFQRSNYYKNGNSGQTGTGKYILGGFSCYWEDLIQVNVTSNELYKVDRVTSFVNVVTEYYADKVACSTTEEPDVEWTKYDSYLDRETGTLYYDGRYEGDNYCSFIGDCAKVTNADTGELIPVENPHGDFYIVIKAYDNNGGIIGSVTLSYRVDIITAI